MSEPQECLLQRALDAHERCPGADCPFFDDGECRLRDLKADLDTNPQLDVIFGCDTKQQIAR